MNSVSLLKGRHGKTTKDSCVAKFDLIEMFLHSPCDTVDQERTRQIDLAARRAGSIEHVNDAIKVPAVVLDDQGGFTTMHVPLYKAPKVSGYVVGKTRPALVELISATHKSLTPSEMNATEVKVFVAKFHALDAILIFPKCAVHVPTFNGLDLVSSPEFGIMAVELRLCDGYGVGKSKALLSASKFKFLVPTYRAPINDDHGATPPPLDEPQAAEVLMEMDVAHHPREHHHDPMIECFHGSMNNMEVIERLLCVVEKLASVERRGRVA